VNFALSRDQQLVRDTARAFLNNRAIKHKLSEMMTLVAAALSTAYCATWVADTSEGELEEAASIARAYCSDAFITCAGDAIQIHGGIGFTWEHDIHLYFKRATSSATLLADPAHHRELIALSMGLDASPGGVPS
jgi:alkylation response protein AidB-like acyl-CoA dehydrogenase